MTKTKRVRKATVEEEILGYFLRNPAGTDTLEGIASWRLFDERIYRSIEETDRAVNALVSQGFLIKDRPSAHSKCLFRLDLKKRAEAEQYFKQTEEEVE